MLEFLFHVFASVDLSIASDVTMALFGIGIGRGDARQFSQSDSLGFSQSISGSTQSRTARSASTSQDVQQAVSGSQQRIAFQDIFQDFFGGAASAAGSIDPTFLQGRSDQLFTRGTDFLSSLEDGGAGEEFLQNRVSGESPVLGQQIGALEEDVGRFFREELLTGIRRGSTGAGTLGGGRQGVAESLAAREATQQFQRGATQLRAEDIRARDAAARDLLGLQTQRTQTGLSALPTLAGLAEQSALAPLSSFSALGGILGGPTTLTDAASRSTGVSSAQAESFDRAFGSATSESFGLDLARGRGRGIDEDIDFNLGFS